MSKKSTSRRVESKKISRKNSIILFGSITIILAAVCALLPKLSAAAQSQTVTPIPGQAAGGIVYVQSDEQGSPRALIKIDQKDLSSDGDSGTTLASVDLPQCDIGGLYAAPHGQWIAVQVNCPFAPFVQVVHITSGHTHIVGADLGPDGRFLAWSPNGNELVLKVDRLGDARIYLVNAVNDKAELLPVPATTYNVDISKNGKQMIYSLTQGLGYGSETWVADVDGGNARLVLADPTHIIAFARWSPKDDSITYIRMPDSNIPFTVGELWIMDNAGSNAVFLGEVDAGHGYEPAWSPDGSRIAFVARENKSDRAADQHAEYLVSNVNLVDVDSGNIEAVTPFSGALTENPVWSSDGEYLAFNTTADGGMDAWTYQVTGKTLHKITHGKGARYPVWFAAPGN